MNRNLTATFAIAVVCLALPGFGRAQDKKIHVVKGQKLVLKGSVVHGRDRSYLFKAKKGQCLTVKLTGSDAGMIVLFAQHNFDAEAFSEDGTSWTGKLPRAESGEYAVRLGSYFRVATYRLEILLK